MDENVLSPNALLGLSHLFKLSATSPQRMPGQVFVLIPAEDCEPISRILLAESIRRRENEPPRPVRDA
jgi:hypothetical protein